MYKHILHAIVGLALFLSPNMLSAFNFENAKLDAALNKKNPAMQKTSNGYEAFTKIEDFAISQARTSKEKLNHAFKLYLIGIFPETCAVKLDNMGPKMQKAWRSDLAKYYSKGNTNVSNQASVKEISKFIKELSACQIEAFDMLRSINPDETVNALMSEGMFKRSDERKLFDVLDTLYQTNENLYSVAKSKLNSDNVPYDIYLDELEDLPTPTGVDSAYFPEDPLFAFIEAEGFSY